MAIIVNLDVMMAKRKITLGDLADRIGITPANLSILKDGLKPKLYAFLLLRQFVRSSIATGGYTRIKKMKREVLDMNDYFLTICKYASHIKADEVLNIVKLDVYADNM